MDIQRQPLSFRRKAAFLVGAILTLLLVTRILTGAFAAIAAGFSLFLGATDFGRQCPLWLSVQSMYARSRRGRQE